MHDKQHLLCLTNKHAVCTTSAFADNQACVRIKKIMKDFCTCPSELVSVALHDEEAGQDKGQRCSHHQGDDEGNKAAV